METGGHAFVAVDVHYLGSGGARAAAVVTADDRFSEVVAERTEVLAEVLPYRPGDFYLRELPPIRAVLSGLSGLSLLVVDGYADLDSGGRPGLGAHAHAEFDVPVIGVAKSAFPTATHAVPVLRGTSVRPLFITAAGMPRDEAVDLVRHMAGQHRLPNAIRRADTLARTSPPAAELTHSSTADQARIAAKEYVCDKARRCINIRPGGLTGGDSNWVRRAADLAKSSG
jgi:deoxyribonuclease V